MPRISNCQSIEGRYDNKGEGYEKYPGPYFLSPILFGSEISNHAAVNSVKITQKKNELILEAYTNESEIIKSIVNLKNAKCSKGLLEINDPDPEGFESGGGVIGYGSDVIQLAKDSAGSLIVRVDTKAFGIYLIPFGGSTWQWYRFPPKKVPPIQRPKKTSGSSENYIKHF